jgi:hypothetical protein
LGPISFFSLMAPHSCCFRRILKGLQRVAMQNIHSHWIFSRPVSALNPICSRSKGAFMIRIAPRPYPPSLGREEAQQRTMTKPTTTVDCRAPKTAYVADFGFRSSAWSRRTGTNKWQEHHGRRTSFIDRRQDNRTARS